MGILATIFAAAFGGFSIREYVIGAIALAASCALVVMYVLWQGAQTEIARKEVVIVSLKQVLEIRERMISEQKAEIDGLEDANAELRDMVGDISVLYQSALRSIRSNEVFFSEVEDEPIKDQGVVSSAASRAIIARHAGLLQSVRSGGHGAPGGADAEAEGGAGGVHSYERDTGDSVQPEVSRRQQGQPAN